MYERYTYEKFSEGLVTAYNVLCLYLATVWTTRRLPHCLFPPQSTWLGSLGVSLWSRSFVTARFTYVHLLRGTAPFCSSSVVLFYPITNRKQGWSRSKGMSGGRITHNLQRKICPSFTTQVTWYSNVSSKYESQDIPKLGFWKIEAPEMNFGAEHRKS